jgi:hypothetical protein
MKMRPADAANMDMDATGGFSRSDSDSGLLDDRRVSSKMRELGQRGE